MKWTIINGKWVQIPMVLTRENGRLVERFVVQGRAA